MRALPAVLKRQERKKKAHKEHLLNGKGSHSTVQKGWGGAVSIYSYIIPLLGWMPGEPYSDVSRKSQFCDGYWRLHVT